MTLVLHHSPMTRSVRSLWLLHEIGVPFEVVPHAFGPALRAPDYLEIAPLGRVPLLEDGPPEARIRISESGAICEYLCEQYDPGMLWRWPGHVDRAEWLQWLHFAETMGQHLAALTQAHIMIQPPEVRPAIVMKLEAKRLEKTLGVLQHKLEKQDYLLPGGFSAVDTGIGWSVHFARFFADLEAFPAVSAYHTRLAGRAAFRKSVPEPLEDTFLTQPFYAVPIV
ncbi:MAG: glutathione S-transferase family protein [Pseudomonadota bacterium]